MPALALHQPTSPASALPSWVLDIVIAIFVFVFLMTSVVLGSRALSRRRLRSQAGTVPLPSPVNFIATSWRRRSSAPKLKPLLLGSSLSQPTGAVLRPNINKEFTLVRGARLSRTLSSSSGAPILPPLAIYSPGLHTPAPARRISVRMVTPPVSTGLDTPPPTPIIPPPVRVEDLIRQRAEASSEYALPPSDSTTSSLFSCSSSSSCSLTSLLDLFPTPPTSGEVKPTRPVENLYPTPPPSPSLVPVVEFPMPTKSDFTVTPTPTPLQPTALSHLISPSNSDMRILDRLFTSSRLSSPPIPEMTPFTKPECPPLHVFTAYKAPIVTFSPMQASNSFYASIEDAAENGYLTPPASPLWR
ncbi:hypothetical protein PENSPDRAFT_692846 [Peniophora sp. CONT]|nr:hypothetical protein PENSPDRAFT_692846 [Peniophora sp. CONT]